jgi:hypothetical protein
MEAKMKKWLVLSIVLVALVALLAPMALAQGPMDGSFGTGRTPMMAGPGGQGYGPGYVDQNGDGVCDNFVDENGDGVCDNAGTGGHGPGFTDEDGDGVCDHAGTGGQHGPRRGQRMQGRWMQQNLAPTN